MMMIKFRSSEEHDDLLKKVKRMRKFTEELEDMLRDCLEEEEEDFRGNYRKHYDDEDMRAEGRYGYRRMR